ncbi:MAG: ribosome small subunit-dependent GTPase A [Clostridia bacterium]|nr:ribosome small subunit-dependent GTPase A [Clostridia bacterium]
MVKMLKGTIIKGYSSFYYVDIGERIISCSLRGKNRLGKNDFYPGDLVEIKITNEDKSEGVIERTLERKNFLLRPPVANIDQIIITSAMKQPSPDYMLIDRLMAVAVSKNIDPVLVFNKIDLSDEQEIEEVRKRYEESEATIIFISTMEKDKIPLYKKQLEEILMNKINILAGISGVGKTSIINILDGGDDRAVGKISEKLKRGKHTTRHTELVQIGDHSWLADSPGFSSLDFPKDFKPEMLPRVYIDYLKYSNLCKFNNCFHLEEPDCEIKRKIEEGILSKERYENYKYLIEELKSREGSQY